MNAGKQIGWLTVIGIAALFWVGFFISIIAIQAVFIRRTYTIDGDWLLFCIATGIVVLASTLGIALVRTYSKGQLFTYLAGSVAGSTIVFSWFGALAGSLSQQGFVWIYIPMGVVPGALQGLVTYVAVNRPQDS